MENAYAGMFVIDLKDMSVLATSDSQHQKDLKAFGGMLKEKDKSIRAAAYREGTEEGQTQVTKSTLVFVETVNNRQGMHKRYFFLADEISSALAKGATWEVEEKDASGHVVEKVTTKWVPFMEFVERLFFKQYPAFGAVLAELGRRNPELLKSQKFCELMERFPEPENLGLEGANVD
jgi:ADP-ribose pyrophosphatase YjhB (NUDIX family)